MYYFLCFFLTQHFQLLCVALICYFFYCCVVFLKNILWFIQSTIAGHLIYLPTLAYYE